MIYSSKDLLTPGQSLMVTGAQHFLVSAACFWRYVVQSFKTKCFDTSLDHLKQTIPAKHQGHPLNKKKEKDARGVPPHKGSEEAWIHVSLIEVQERGHQPTTCAYLCKWFLILLHIENDNVKIERRVRERVKEIVCKAHAHSQSDCDVSAPCMC